MKRAIVCVLAATTVFGAVQPAGAATTYSVKKAYAAIAGTLTQAATAKVEHEDATTVTISLECTADAKQRGNDPIGAAATGMPECFLLGADGTRHDAADAGAFPGNHIRRVGLFHGLKRQHYRVCVKSTVFWRSNSIFYAAPRLCSV